MTYESTVLGRPVIGDYTPAYKPRRGQWQPQIFMDRLDALLALPGVESVKWEQYTPYFNDGDACVFGVHDPRVLIAGSEEEAGEYEDGYLTSWDDELRDHPDVKEALKSFEEAHEHSENFLRDSFGDHAEVFATTAGFTIEECSHD